MKQYFRSGDALWGGRSWFKESKFFLWGKNFRAEVFAEELNFITTNLPGLKIVLVGASQGAAFGLQRGVAAATRPGYNRRTAKSASAITEKSISEAMYTAGQPDPDLIVRTSGEQRISGFLAWQGVYSELMFVEKNWPDFTERDLDDVLDAFKQRQRRFGS